jgi:hypothetical protein
LWLLLLLLLLLLFLIFLELTIFVVVVVVAVVAIIVSYLELTIFSSHLVQENHSLLKQSQLKQILLFFQFLLLI